jgi:uncharacterized membrane protein HdeD (DUF308 family)
MPSLRRAVLLRGILMVIAGIAILALLVWKPLDVLAAFGILVGAFFAVAGIMRTVTGIVAGGLSAGMRALNIAIGVLVCVIGLIAMVSPGFGLMTLAIMVGVAWIFEGVAALSMLPQSRRGIWVFFGIVSLLAGLAIVALPWATVVPLVVLTGVALVLFGIVDTANGIRMGSDG